MMNDSWDMEHDRNFCHFGPIFALLPSKQPEKSKFWKNEKNPIDIIILQMYQKS